MGLTLKKSSKFSLKSLSAMYKNECTESMKERSWATVLLLHSIKYTISI